MHIAVVQRMLLNALVSLLQFTTVLPLGRPVGLEAFARRSYIYPIAGYVTGGIAALATFWISEATIAAAMAVAALLLITGCHHFDGLLDLGDGLMAHGSSEKRIRALTDRQVGAGGVAAGLSVTLITFASLIALHPIVWALITAEVAGKFSMALLTAYGKPFKEGTHSYLHSYARPWYPFLAAILCVPLVLLPISPVKLAFAAILMVATPVLLLFISKHLFGGVNGDVTGASNEVVRAVVLAAMVLI
ncbi:MAG: adenosylcobinamide-GDP ribazoletransferase [Methanoregulaceae archaeon]|nr:adenosylcobinamide-GDP ribazoletransferase [Methanoregulaceae archaeon]